MAANDVSHVVLLPPADPEYAEFMALHYRGGELLDAAQQARYRDLLRRYRNPDFGCAEFNELLNLQAVDVLDAEQHTRLDELLVGFGLDEKPADEPKAPPTAAYMDTPIVLTRRGAYRVPRPLLRTLSQYRNVVVAMPRRCISSRRAPRRSIRRAVRSSSGPPGREPPDEPHRVSNWRRRLTHDRGRG